MLVWLAFAALAAMVVGLVIRPLAMVRGRVSARAAYDGAVYRDQLKEIARDADRGLLTPAEAASARLEIERRLLASAETPGYGSRPAAKSAVAPFRLTVVLAVLVPLGAVAIYLVHGAPRIPDQPYAARAAERAFTRGNGELDLDKTVAALQARLKAEPDSAEGWLLLAQTQAARGRWQESADAYREAMTLTKERPDVAAAYAEMLVMAAGGVVTPAARDALAKVAARDPENPSARYYLALAEAQAGNVQGAIDAWQALLAQAPADAPWAQIVRQRIADTAKAAGLPVPAAPAAPALPGPSADDVAAAAQLSPEQRSEMIRGMVERLAARLKETPDDLQGWLRLGRAYEVLKQPEKSADAYAQAATLKPEDPAILARELDALMTDRPPTEPIPARALAVLTRLQTLGTDDPSALWYLGLAAAQAHELDEAKAYWQKLLAVLPADSDERKMVSDALAALPN
jgi:cytochrome c-type biogenesis protein CcmH